jgi:hypothetical protein
MAPISDITYYILLIHHSERNVCIDEETLKPFTAQSRGTTMKWIKRVTTHRAGNSYKGDEYSETVGIAVNNVTC